MAKKLYIVTLLHKIPKEDRDVYRAHANPSEFEDMFASENREVGEPAIYSQWLEDEAADAFARASNVKYVEEAQEHRKLGGAPTWEKKALTPDIERNGVEQAVLDYHRFTDATGPTGEGVIVGVGDTGYKSWPYTEKRLVGMWNFTKSPDGYDRDGHGSWCQGAATPANAKLISGKVLGDNGTGYTSWGIAFVRRFTDFCVAQRKPGVLSYSLGGGGYSQAYEDAARYAAERGVIMIAASGNESKRSEVSSPANCASVFSVGAMSHHNGSIANFSNRDSEPREPDIYAAGVDVAGQGDGRWSGTSMATPLVARAAARAIGVQGATVGKVKYNLLASASEKARYDGHGKLGVAGLMRRMQNG
jgi:hypothetical protein